MKPSPFLLFLLVWCSSVAPASCLHIGQCNAALGMQSGLIPDDSITASSSYDAAVSAIYGRAHVEAGGGAWCPRERVHQEGKEFLQVDLGALQVITRVEVQGRFGNGMGREFARSYKIQYWRPSLDRWITYADGRGGELLEGNSNTYLAKASRLSPPFIASRVRFLPYSDLPRTVCMRIELYGCRYTEGLVSYSMPDGAPRGKGAALADLTYDGDRKAGRVSGGLGQLADGEEGRTDFRTDALGSGTGYEWVGWRNSTLRSQPVQITFHFDSIRNFSAVYIYANNLFTKDVQVFSYARVLFSLDGKNFDQRPAVEYRYPADRIFEEARNVSIIFQTSAAAKHVRLQLFFALKWIMVSEISFASVPCHCILMDREATETASEYKRNEERIVKTNTFPVETSWALLLGGLVCLALCGLLPVVLGVKYYQRWLAKISNQKLPSPSLEIDGDSKEMLMKMKDFHISVNLSPVYSGSAKARGKLYGLFVGEKSTAVYEEPFNRSVPIQSKYAFDRILTPSEVPLSRSLSSEGSMAYAVSNAEKTPPPPSSEVCTPLPPPSPPPPLPVPPTPATLPTVHGVQYDSSGVLHRTGALEHPSCN